MSRASLSFRRMDDGVEVAVLAGEIDIAGAPAMTQELLARVAVGDGLVLDIGQATYLDSGGVRLLDRVAGRCRERGVPFAVVGPPGSPARAVLEICAFPAHLIADDLSGALAAVRRR